jgi:hypothetical protein
MTQLVWDATGDRMYETGVDHGVLYKPNESGVYTIGVAWNGLTAVTESPSGAEPSAQYADNIKYVTLRSTEEFGGTIEAFTYPDEFNEHDGFGVHEGGVYVGQQTRVPFGLAYRTKIGNDTVGQDFGYKLHLVYGATATPSERAYNTISDSPEAVPFSWEFTTDPVAVGTVGGVYYKPTSSVIIDSTKVDQSSLNALEDLLFGTSGTDPQLPLPAAVMALFTGTIVEVEPSAPTYNSTTKVITIPSVTGVEYLIGGEVVASGAQPAITEDTVVTARPAQGYKFPAVTDDDWVFYF